MIADIISIGSELLRGELTDSNASWLATQLIPCGIEIGLITQVGDNQQRLADTLRRAWSRSDLVIATGGLGPTSDDLTRESIAEMFGETLRVDPLLESQLRDLFAQFGRPMPAHNIKQATLIPSAQAIPNPLGTAPGWWIEREGKMLAALPGPPREMQNMWTTAVLPRIMHRMSGAAIRCRTLKILGLSEAGIDEMIGTAPCTALVEIGIYAKSDGIHLRLIAKDSPQGNAQERIQEVERVLRNRFGHHLWGVDDETLTGIVGKLLIEKGQTLATLESFSGGLLASSVGSDAKSSQYYRGGIVLGFRPGNAEPLSCAGHLHDPSLPPGDAASSMADAARHHMCAAIGVGIAGPHWHGADDRTVAIAVSDGDKKRIREAQWPMSRYEVRQWIALAALFELKLFLSDH